MKIIQPLSEEFGWLIANAKGECIFGRFAPSLSPRLEVPPSFSLQCLVITPISCCAGNVSPCAPRSESIADLFDFEQKRESA